jgi:hypothetical protein
MKLAAIALAGAAVILTITPSVAAPKRPFQQCMTDDGYGRYRPCSSLYKRQNPNWRSGPECMTDDGYGRYRPCSSLYWQGSNGPPPSYTPPGAKKPPGY